MNAVNPKSSEPSMDEILASIRRIIADDQETVNAAKPDELQEDDILDLAELPQEEAETDEMDVNFDDVTFEDVSEMQDVVEEPEEPQAFAMTNDEEELAFSSFENSQEEPEPQPFAPMAFSASTPSVDSDRLVSTTTDSAVSQAFNMLASTVLNNNSRTLEDLVKEMLKPMLKVWLDDNLPTVVERLVRAEIERVARGR